MKSEFQDPAQDPRLTAYALGELTDPKDIQAVESLLRRSPALRREVESLRATAELIQLELKQEPCPSLAPEQLASLGEPPRSRRLWPQVRPGNRSWWFPAGLATAAALAVMVSAAILFLQETEEAPLSAGLRRPEPVVDEVPADSGRITEQAHDPAGPDPDAAASPQALVQTAPEPPKTVSPAPPAGLDSSGTPVPVPAEATVVSEKRGNSGGPGTSLVSTVDGRINEPRENPGIQNRRSEENSRDPGLSGPERFPRESLGNELCSPGKIANAPRMAPDAAGGSLFSIGNRARQPGRTTGHAGARPQPVQH